MKGGENVVKVTDAQIQKYKELQRKIAQAKAEEREIRRRVDEVIREELGMSLIEAQELVELGKRYQEERAAAADAGQTDASVYENMI
jgi:ribosomal protein L7/L12